MAIQTLTGKPGLGELFGTGISSGISKGLEQLAKQKAESLQRQQGQMNSFNSLVQVGVPQNWAQAIASSPKHMQKSMLQHFMELNADQGGSLLGPGQQQAGPDQQVGGLEQVPQQQQQQVQQQQRAQVSPEEMSKIDRLLNFRKRALKHQKLSSKGALRSRLKDKEFSGTLKSKLADKPLFKGLDRMEREFVWGNKLTEEIAQILLFKANGDPKKARKLAKKFGYRE